MLTGYRLLQTVDLEIKYIDFQRDKNNYIRAGIYNGYLDKRINAIEIVLNERNENNG